jgi:hypothetical protein
MLILCQIYYYLLFKGVIVHIINEIRVSLILNIILMSSGLILLYAEISKGLHNCNFL